MINILPVLKGFFRKSGIFIRKNSPTILTILGTGGTLTAVTFAVKDTPKAMLLIDKRKQELGVEKLTPLDTVKACWPVYIPTAGMTLASIGCFIGANSIHLRRNTALAGLYATTEQTLREYREQVKEKLGPEMEDILHQETTEKVAESKKESTSDAVLMMGDELCYDEFSGQFFRSDPNEIKNKVLDIKRELVNTMYISATDVYDILGDDGQKLHVPLLADGRGWTIDDDFDIKVSDMRVHGRHCNLLTFASPPHENYNMMY